MLVFGSEAKGPGLVSGAFLVLYIYCIDSGGIDRHVIRQDWRGNSRSWGLTGFGVENLLRSVDEGSIRPVAGILRGNI